MARVLFLAIISYLVYRLVVELIIPVIKTTSTMKRQFNGRQTDNQHSKGSQEASSRPDKTKAKVGEYIDFEEIKN